MTDRHGSFDSFSYEKTGGYGTPGRATPSEDPNTSQNKEAAKLKQIVQHFFTKAALTIVSSRVSLPQCFYRDSDQVRSNKWFNLVLDESDILADDVAEWASADVIRQRPEPLTIEILLDTSELTRNQTLVIVDERGRKWDVCEALSSPTSSATGTRHRKSKNAQVILERWTIHLGESDNEPLSNATDSMPNVYKKAVVMFRSLFTYARFLPAWKFGLQIAKQPATLNSLRPFYRITRGKPQTPQKDPLDFALYPTADSPSETYHIKPTKSPAGPLSIDVTYRVNCDFRIDDAEALLSSHFMGMDEHYFRPSLDDRSGQDFPYLAGGKEVGSLPVDRRGVKDLTDPSQAYGSLSTFHNLGPSGASPISALRAASQLTSGSPSGSPPPREPTQSRPQQASKDVPKPVGAMSPERRISVSFQPFKAGSLSSSPVPTSNLTTSPSTSAPKSSNLISGVSHTKNRTSISTLPQTALRAPPANANEIAVATPSSGSPKAPVNRYSSSFGNRRPRLPSTGAGSKTEDDNNSSGRASQTSSNQPSGLLAEQEGGGSSESAQTDDDNISDFLKLLEQKRDLSSFNMPDETSRNASTRRTTAALTKFQRLRDSHSVVTDSMSSSMMHRSSTSSTRQASSLPPSSVPPQLAGNSVSTSSSPGKPISPHTPHTPFIRSRLSAHATIDDSETSVSRTVVGSSQQSGDFMERDNQNGYGSRPGAIPIPTSPQGLLQVRRPSSAAPAHRGLDDLDDYAVRSASLPSEERPDLSLGELLAFGPVNHGYTAERSNTVSQRRLSNQRTGEAPVSSSAESYEGERRPYTTGGTGLYPSSFRSRGTRGGGRGSASSSRYGFGVRGVSADDEEPLLFTMSELQGRRSAEEDRNSPGTRSGRRQSRDDGPSNTGSREGDEGQW